METRQATKSPTQQRSDFRMAAPLSVVVASKETSVKFEHIDAPAQQKIATQATAVKTFRTERNRWESSPARQETIQPPTGQRGTVTPPSERKEPVTAKAQREVHVIQPERVKVPPPPIVGKQGAAEKSPPPRPLNERKNVGEVKETPKNIQPTGNAKDNVKESPKKKQPTGNAKEKGKGKGK